MTCDSDFDLEALKKCLSAYTRCMAKQLVDNALWEVIKPLLPPPPTRTSTRGRSRQRPEKLRADKAYDDRALRRGLRKRGITPRIARRGVESSARLGRYRWVVERTLSWQQGFRRLRVRDEKRDDIYEALTHLANAMICWERLNGHFC